MTTALSIARMASPLGSLTLWASERGLAGVDFEEAAGDRPQAPEALATRLARQYPGASVSDTTTPVLAQALDWLSRYFEGDAPEAKELPLDLAGTDFEREVWSALLDVPYGQTETYGSLARRLGRPTGAARAIGGAVGRNPVGIVVPCHRILGTNGSLTGYAGGLERKRWLLHHEGALLLP